MKPGTRVRCTLDVDDLLGREGIVIEPPPRAATLTNRTWIRWSHRILSNGYRPDHPILDNLEVMR